MGTWDTGPFDNDTAADFADTLDDTAPEAREALVRAVLVRTIDATDWLREAEAAVAAAALIAAQCPGGDPVDTSYGPRAPTPRFPSDLRALADEAVARVATAEEGPSSDWTDQKAWERWQAMLARLRAVLAPSPPTIALFDVEP
ncbi:DUF4259 domain-containing protein [Streptomyces sp. NPDC060198]|uniref:DUF4259 domain-containing protein n=1 Tax=Streptomyces sp. NPDC060198 TaxID=3347070 RepID=UPI0036583E6C